MFGSQFISMNSYTFSRASSAPRTAMRNSLMAALLLMTLMVLTLMGSALHPAQAQTAKVLILNAASTPGDPTDGNDVKKKLMNTGRFAQVDLFLADQNTPTQAQLQQYDAVITFSFVQYADSKTLGDLLTDYANGGKRVVVATYAADPNNGRKTLGGRFASGGYSPFTSIPGGDLSGPRSLLVPDIANSPFLTGVKSFDGNEGSFRQSVGLAAGATQVAHWNDAASLPLVAYKRTGSAFVVGLNFFPPSSDTNKLNWNSATDGAALMANALLVSLSTAPTATTGPATGITATSATLNGSINPNGAATTAMFQYGLTTNYGNDVPITLNPADGTTAKSVFATVTDLTPLTTYHYRVTANNINGSRNGADATFTTNEKPSLIVTTNSDNSTPTDDLTSLREAINFANTKANAPNSVDNITFAIPTVAGEVQTIQLASNLPAITEAVTIDGYSQAGAKANTLAVGSDAIIKIEIRGNGTGNFDGLTLASAGSTIKGLSIGNCNSGINITGATGNVVSGNFIGVAADGSTVLPNVTGISIGGAPDNTIGGTNAAARNVISANFDNAIGISGKTATGNVVSGNYIGTSASGLTRLSSGKSGSSDSITVNGAPGNTIGGTSAAARNVISGQGTGAGVRIKDTTATGNVVSGNYIGLAADGTTVLPNGDGVILDNAPGNTVGGNSDGARNVISGNLGSGINIRNNAATGNTVIGNYIGVAADGATPRGNSTGILIGSAPNNTIGGTTAGARNVISGNNTSTNGSRGVTIGGAAATGNVVSGNYIGVAADGIAVIEGQIGVLINGAPNNTIGGTNTGAGNLISGHKFAAIDIIGGNTATGNNLRGNSITKNTRFGIDLNDDGATANDAGDADTGPNNLQNYPVILNVTNIGGNVQISGTFNSNATKDYVLDFYDNDVTLPNGYGEGKTLLGSLPVTADGTDKAFSLTLNNVNLKGGNFITATATRTSASDGTGALGDTSEFSLAKKFEFGPAPPESGLVVTTLSDIQASDGVTSLREAVDAANRDGGKDSPITFAVSGTIKLTGGELTLVSDGKVSITGPAKGITIVGDGKSRVFNIVSGADATITGVNITGGGNSAILNNSALTINNSALFNNTSGGNGGAILNNGTLTTTNTTIAGNSAQGNGGAIFNSPTATLSSLNSTIVGNVATAGGGIFKGKSLTLTNSIVVGNNGDNLSGVADAGGNNVTSGTNAAAGLDAAGLKDNGGPVQTIALTTRGTAVNAGDNALAAGLTTDARGAGFPRIVSSKVDVGAFESAFGNRAPSLNNATFSTSINVPFSQQLAGVDADGDSLSYSKASGTLPAGVTLSASGLLSGTPNVAGRYEFSVNVFDGTDTTVARFIIIVSSNADGIGPIITRAALNASYTRDEFANIVYRGTVRDVAPNGVTPSGVAQVTFQLRRNSDGFAYSGSESTGFTSNKDIGYFPAFLSEPTSNTAAARDYRRTFGANGFVPSANVLKPGAYSLVIVAKDNAGNFSVEVVPATITAATAPASSALRSDSAGNS